MLATDGLPNCPVSGNVSNDDAPGAIAAVAAALSAGIPTLVVGILPPGSAAEYALDMMAVVGGYATRAPARRNIPVKQHGRVRGGAANTGRDGERLHVLRPAAADERRHYYPREHHRQGIRRRRRQELLRYDATNGCRRNTRMPP